MQSCTMPEKSFAELAADRERMERLGRVHHQHLGNGRVLVKQVVSGPTSRAVHDRLDRSESVLRAAGGEGFHRARIGRNTFCPCGSGRKFKKCCIDKAEVATG